MDGRRDWADGPYGVKRAAEDQLESEQRLTKRLGLLNLARTGDGLITDKQPVFVPKTAAPDSSGESMQIDDTKNRIYVANLDDELSEGDATEDRLVFLPDIEKRLTKIPRSVLTNQRSTEAAKNELVLYGIPSSLSVPKEQDNVRRAILESRARAREKAAELRPDRSRPIGFGPVNDEPHVTPNRTPGTPTEVDFDVMDLG